MEKDLYGKVVDSLKNYNATNSQNELLSLIKQYSKLNLNEELIKYINEFFKQGGDAVNLREPLSGILDEDIEELFDKVEEESMEEEDFDGDSFLEMGELLWEIGSPGEAKDNYLRAFKYYSLQGNVSAAKEVLNTLNERYPGDSEVSSLEIRDIKEKIISSIGNLEGLSPEEEVKVRYQLGKKMHEADLLIEAEKNYRRILEIDSSHRVKRYLISLLKEKKKFDEVLEIVEDLEENERIEEFYSIAKTLREAGQAKKADSILEKVYRIAPEYKDVKSILGYEEEEEKIEEKEAEEEVTLVETVKQKKDIEEEKVNEEIDEEENKIVFL